MADTEAVYVVAETVERARDWARQNQPRKRPRCFSVNSEIGPRGLLITDVPVYILDDMPGFVRESWALTGANLIYV